MPRLSQFLATLALFTLASQARPQSHVATSTEYGRWTNGVPDDPDFFPLAVWLQSPHNAERFKTAGINLYVGLHRGPTEEQLTALKQANMPVICAQTDLGLRSENASIIVGWMHGDEPDNAQPKKSGGYGPPIEPRVIEDAYKQIRGRDPTRPVFLNLGQGVAYDNYIGRGVRRNHPEDYPLYIRGGDIVSFDIYPAVHDNAEVAGKLEFVANGVERLRQWSRDEKIVWNCIEASRISNPTTKPSPEQVRSEVWMSLIRGSRGIVYFVHQFEPTFKEASLLDDPKLLPAVTALNRTITKLAPVLNSPSVDDAVIIESAEGETVETPLELMCKRHDGSLYVFVANVTSQQAAATLRFLNPLSSAAQAETIEAGDKVSLTDTGYRVELAGYGVGLYRITGESPPASQSTTTDANTPRG